MDNAVGLYGTPSNRNAATRTKLTVNHHHSTWSWWAHIQHTAILTLCVCVCLIRTTDRYMAANRWPTHSGNWQPHSTVYCVSRRSGDSS